MRARKNVLLAIGIALISGMARADTVDADLVFRNGTLIDGSGHPPVKGDLAIKDGSIVAVGEFKSGDVERTIDCTNLMLTPGFIDLHNHSDESILADSTRNGKNYLLQGCTTIVTGNCGAGALPVKEYLDQIDELTVGINVLHLIPQGTLRKQILGSEKVVPNADQIERMQRQAAQGMQDGAWGISTGLIYVPGAYATTDELVAIASTVAEHDGIYASHIRNEEANLLESIDEALEIGRQAKIPVHVSHFKVVGEPYWGLVREAARRIERARADGQTVTADQYPYIATSTSLGAMLLPSWARSGGREATAQRVKSGERIDEIRTEITNALAVRKHIRIAAYPANPDFAGQRIRELSNARQQDLIELVLEIVANGDASAVNFALGEEDVRYVMGLPWVATASDGSLRVPSDKKIHPRSYGTFPRKVRHYALDLAVIELGAAIRSCSGLPADILQLPQRGYLRVGYAADLVVFDPARFADTATFDKPHQYSTGVRWLAVNGTLAVDDYRFTESLAGKAIRK